MPYASEYTPEIDQEFLRRMTAGLEQRGAASMGRARGEAISRGLGGDVYEASAVGAAEQGMNQSIGDAMAEAAYRRAGLQREERMIGEGRAYGTGERVATQAWQSGENQANRNFNERMARLGYDMAGDAASTANRRKMQGELWGMVGGIAGYGLGAGLGSMGGGGSVPSAATPTSPAGGWI